MSGHVLLTGASGLVGAEVAARLEAAGRGVVALTHQTDGIRSNDGSAVSVTHTVPGDVCLPGFGPAVTERADEFGREVTAIVHCAATTAFDATDDEYERLNVAGTAHAIECALAWEVPLVHVSTAYVCGMRGGLVREDELDHGQSFGNRYEKSKFTAERLVEEARQRGLRATTVRPGIVTGAVTNGAIRDHKNLYTVVKLMVEGKLRTLPGRYDATVSLAPVDHVADVITAATLNVDSLDGMTHHALGSHPLTLRELSDVLAEYPSFEVATYVPESSFDVDALDRREQQYYRRVGSLYTSYFTRKLTFGTDHADQLMGRPAPECGPDYLRLLLDNSLDVGYLGAPLASVDEVLARIGGQQ